jgi:hypothetical protein
VRDNFKTVKMLSNLDHSKAMMGKRLSKRLVNTKWRIKWNSVLQHLVDIFRACG